MLQSEDGQALTEYALILAVLLLGGGYTILRFFPDALAAWKGYVGGFYLVLSLP